MTKKADDTEDLTVSQCAQLLNVGNRTIRKWLDSYRLESYIVPGGTGERRIPVAGVRSFLLRNRMEIPPQLDTNTAVADITVEKLHPVSGGISEVIVTETSSKQTRRRLLFRLIGRQVVLKLAVHERRESARHSWKEVYVRKGSARNAGPQDCVDAEIVGQHIRELALEAMRQQIQLSSGA